MLTAYGTSWRVKGTLTDSLESADGLFGIFMMYIIFLEICLIESELHKILSPLKVYV